MIGALTADAKRVFMSRVYAYMGVGLLFTGAVAYLFFANESVASLIYYMGENDEGEMVRNFNWLGYVFLLAPLALIFLKASWARSKPYGWVMAVYFLICGLMGATLSSIFMVYDMGSIYLAFGTASATFLGMSFIGATTKTDLTKMGGWLISALWGIIAASVLNWFFQSSTLDYIICYVGVLVFVGLVAYDTQKLLKIATEVEDTGDMDQIQKAAIWGGFDLYLDFINLFLFFLRIFGGHGKD